MPFAETDEFREKFAKAPVVQDDATFISIRKWFEMNEYL